MVRAALFLPQQIQACGSMYNPRDFGAQCDLCPLGPNGPDAIHHRDGAWNPVPPEHWQTTVIAVAEAPGHMEEIHGGPLQGPIGDEWNTALAAAGYPRHTVSSANLLACRPHNDNFQGMLDTLKKWNADPENPTFPSPIACCLPRFYADVTPYPYVIILGKRAFHAMTGREVGIFSARGGPIEANGRKLLPTIHPNFVLHKQRWRQVFQADIGKAFRFFSNTMRWVTPLVDLRPTPATLRRFFDQVRSLAWPRLACDLETNQKEPIGALIRCIGFSTPDMEGPCWVCEGSGRVRGAMCPVCCGNAHPVTARAVVIPVLSVDGVTRFYDDATLHTLIEMCKEVLLDDGICKIGHNWRYYDWLCLKYAWGVEPHYSLDTIVLTRLRAPELPKALGVIGSILTDVDNWKQDNEGTKLALGVSDETLHPYNALDNVVDIRIVEPLLDAVHRRNQDAPIRPDIKPATWPARQPWNLIGVDHRAQDLCRGMHEVGFWINQVTRKEESVRLVKEAEKWRTIASEIARIHGYRGKATKKHSGGAPINPASSQQMANFLYDVMKLTPKSYTMSGTPSTNDEAMREHIADKGLSDDLRRFIMAARFTRQAIKDRGTMVEPLKMKGLKDNADWSRFGIEFDDYVTMLKEDREINEDDDGIAMETHGLCDLDGRLRSDWNATGTGPGRLSSQHNNQQNVSKKKRRNYRRIYQAAPGHMLVGCDLNQAHLVIIANEWKIPALIQDFETGIDTHCRMAWRAYGDRFVHADGWPNGEFNLKKKPKTGAAGRMRDVSKNIRYAGAYWAQVETILMLIRKTEDSEGNLSCLDYEFPEINNVYNVWMTDEPEWLRQWKRMNLDFKRNGYSESYLFKRRIEFLDGPTKNDICNFPVLSTESEIMRLVESDVMDAIPFFKWGPGTGIINQCHDSLTVECPIEYTDWVKGVMMEAFTRRIPGWRIPVTGEVDAGLTWDKT